MADSEQAGNQQQSTGDPTAVTGEASEGTNTNTGIDESTLGDAIIGGGGSGGGNGGGGETASRGPVAGDDIVDEVSSSDDMPTAASR